jgi:hypothetical protein
MSDIGGVGIDDALTRAHADLACPPDDDLDGWSLLTDPVDVLVAQLRSLESRIASLQAEKARVIAELDRRDTTPERWVQERISVALRVSPIQVRTIVAHSRALVSSLPATLRGFASGALTERKATLIAEASWRLPTALLDAFEERVLRRAHLQTPRQLSQTIARALIRLDPASAEQRRQRATAERDVCFAHLDDGMAELRIVHSADTIQAIRARLDTARTSLPKQDSRTAGQQRADLCVDAILASLGHDALPEVQGRRPTIQVVVAATTLLGADDEPGHLGGYGPITAQMARELAADPTGTWRRLLTDPSTGHLLDAGARTYRPSQHLIDFLTARDGGCSFPTCHAPPERCEIEHCVPFNLGGPTTPSNTALTCHRHNEIKKADGPWSYTINDDTSTWTDKRADLVLDNRPPERWVLPDDALPPY